VRPLNGLFTAGYGIFWFIGSVAIGLLYSVSLKAMIAFSLAAELSAIPLFLLVSRQLPKHRATLGRVV